jgi:D-serine dehydratase
MNISPILETVLDDTVKGIPGGTSPFKLQDIAGHDWNVLRQDLPLPLLVLKESVLAHNEQVMQAFLEEHNACLAPHGKTTMAPQLFKRQLDTGAWGMTAATVSQLQVYRAFGASRILMANQLVGRANIRYIVDQLNSDPAFDFYCLVDSPALVEHMVGYIREAGATRPLNVLVEIGIAGGRTGCRSFGDANAVVTAIKAHPDELALAGVEGYEGILKLERDGGTQAIDRYLMSLNAFLKVIKPEDFAHDEIILSAGGTAYFDRVAEILNKVEYPLPKHLVLRSGCYLTHDSGGYRRQMEAARQRGWTPGFEPALEIWSYVQSTPEPGLALLTMGKRDFPYDVDLPCPVRRYRPADGSSLDIAATTISEANDQHAFLTEIDGLDVAVGDMVACGISHPCTAFDKWRFIPVVDDDYTVTDGILTFF